MQTAEPAGAGAGAGPDARAGAGAPAAEDAGTGSRVLTGARLAAWGALAVVLAGGLALRLWGYRSGLPFVFNIDEADHFVPRAVRMFSEGTLNPHYFANPPAFTYVLHFLFAVAYGGGSGVVRHFQHDPAAVYELSRIAAAVLGTLALWLLYLTGARLIGRAAGLLAAAIEAVAFLPVAYSHLALNDVPTLAPLTASLLGTAGVLRKGRVRDYLLAGAGLGLACATKYTAGIVLVPLLAAAALRLRGPGADSGKRMLAGLLAAALAAAALFVLANPYSVLDTHAFHAELARQSSQASESQGKLGATHEGGVLYYLWTFTWGLGWVPALAALAGLVLVWRREAALGWVLVPAPLLFLAFMGLQGRYFGRYLLPIFPIACLLAAVTVAMLVGAIGGNNRAVRWAAAAIVCAGVLAQGLVHSLHTGSAMARPDTRNLTRSWMLSHIPARSRIVAEPVSPNDWADELTGSAAGSRRWNKYPSEVARIDAHGHLTSRTHEIGVESYETTLAPSLLGYYTANHYCWVVTGSTQSGRAYADPKEVPLAIAYYHALERDGEVVFRASPYSSGAKPVKFDFDWSFDYYPLAYHRPGPVMTVYRLHGGLCGPKPRPART
ncbi:MAG TPA: glycosyltransferase family 39 protein [Solirubrobacteraceae bacterium]|nr:glycosyltransferase family 39 protein [Solirubrobacteraceae bacterium]